MKKIKNFCLIFLSILSAVCAANQPDLETILFDARERLGGIESVRGEVEIEMGSPEPGMDMSIASMDVKFHVRRNISGADTIWNYRSSLTDRHMTEGNCEIYYTGDSLVCVLPDSQIQKTDSRSLMSQFGIGDLAKIYNRIGLFIQRLGLPDSLFYEIPEAWDVGEVELRGDTLIYGKSCFVVGNLRQRDMRLGEDSVRFIKNEMLALDKETHMPVLHTSHFRRWVNGAPQIDQYVSSAFRELAVNRPIPDSVFAVPEMTGFAGQQPSSKVLLKVGEKAPLWKLPSTGGDPVSLDDEQAAAFIIGFGYVGCGHCMIVNKELNEIYPNLAARNIKVYELNGLDAFERIKEYHEKAGLRFPTLKADRSILDKYGVTEYPIYFVLDQDKIVRYIKSGNSNGGKNQEEFLQALAGILK